MKLGMSLLFLFIFSLFPSQYCASSLYNITHSQPLSQGQTLVSSRNIFELGFFSPNNSTNKYVGLWHKSIFPRKYVWVANRENPLASTDKLASLRIGSNGNLELVDGKQRSVWSTNIANSSSAFLLDNGNFVVRDVRGVYLWDSFSNPSDSLLPTMLLGFNSKSGKRNFLTSWKSENDDPTQMSYYPHKPIMAFPPYHYNNAVSMPSVYPMWGQPTGHPANIQMWGTPSYPPWQPSESWHWKPSYPGLHADAWGCPVMPQPLQGGYSPYPQIAAGVHNTNVVDNGCSMPLDSSELHPIASGLNNTNGVDNGCSMPRDSLELHLAEEIIDKVVKEAMSKPWLPLPLGLKLPSTEGVLAELSRQGICNIPPQNNGSSFH